MAAAAYSTDLTLIHACDAASASWTEPTGYIAGAITLPETDYFIQNTGCLSKNMGTSLTAAAGAIYNMGAGQTIPSGNAVFVWLFFGAPNALATQAGGGLRVLVGSLTTAFKHWFVRGSDTYPYGGWVCVAVDPNTAADATTGAPSATLQYFGAAAVLGGTSAVTKGNPFGIDVLRHGRGQLKCINGDVGSGYATFAGAATQNDAVANRWGLCQSVPGGYLQKGLFLMGEVATAVDFRDANTSILIDNTTKVAATFNLFEIRHASSRVDWTSISFLALGTVSRGNFTVTDNATVNWVGCTFTDVGLFSLLGNTTATSCVFRRTDRITTGGAALTNCTVEGNRATSAILVSSPANAARITGTSFTSAGTGHAIEVTGTAANFTISGCKFTGYSGTSTNAAVFINIASGNVEISLTNGSDTPSIRTAGATVTFAATVVTVKVTVKNALTGAAIPSARVIVEKVSDGADVLLGVSDASGIVTTSFSYTADTPVTGVARRASPELGDGTLYKPGPISGSITVSGFDVTILLTPD